MADRHPLVQPEVIDVRAGKADTVVGEITCPHLGVGEVHGQRARQVPGPAAHVDDAALRHLFERRRQHLDGRPPEQLGLPAWNEGARSGLQIDAEQRLAG